MPDIQVAAALLSSTKVAFEMFKNTVAIRDDVKLQTMQSELRMQLLEVMELAVTAKDAELAFIGRESALKAEIAELKEWKAREGEYKLEEIPPGTFAFVSQPTGDSGAQEVWLCPACYEQRRRSPLHNGGHSKDDRHHNIWKCFAQGCKTSVLIEAQLSPGYWRHRSEDIAVSRQIDAAAHAIHLAALKKKRDEG